MILERPEERAWKSIEALPVDDRVELVRDIALRGYSDAFDLVHCRALVHAFPRRALRDTTTHTGAHQVLRSLVERLIIMSESALGLIKRSSDRHARVAIKILASDPAVYSKIAAHGNDDSLRYAVQRWSQSDSDLRRELIKHHRDKSVAHRAISDPTKREPEVDEVYAISGRVASMLAFLATGTGVQSDTSQLASDVAFRNADAFWKPWRTTAGW